MTAPPRPVQDTRDTWIACADLDSNQMHRGARSGVNYRSRDLRHGYGVSRVCIIRNDPRRLCATVAAGERCAMKLRIPAYLGETPQDDLSRRNTEREHVV